MRRIRSHTVAKRFFQTYKSKSHSIYKTKFLRPVLWKTPPSRFYCFYSSQSQYLVLYFLVFSEVNRALCKKRLICYIKVFKEIIYQSWVFCDCFFLTNDSKVQLTPHKISPFLINHIKACRPYTIYTKAIWAVYWPSTTEYHPVPSYTPPSNTGWLCFWMFACLSHYISNWYTF